MHKRISKHKQECKDVFNLAEFYLRNSNDDWLRAEMELNLVGDAIMIGSPRDLSFLEREYIDHQGKLHKLYDIQPLDEVFGCQGNFSDLARKNEFQPIWKTLGCEFSKGRFNMREDIPILLDFDLDYFSFTWRRITKAWIPEFFYREFLEFN